MKFTLEAERTARDGALAAEGSQEPCSRGLALCDFYQKLLQASCGLWGTGVKPNGQEHLDLILLIC